MACKCGGTCGPCHSRRVSGMTPYPHNFPSVKQADKATNQHDPNASVPHQPTATRAVRVPHPTGEGQAVNAANRTWEVGQTNYGSRGTLRWGMFITPPQSRFRQPLDLLSSRGDLTPQWKTDPRVRRKNHAALDEPSYNLGQITEGQVVALAKARAAAAAKRSR
jgi:hypothetical protein